ncbi:MAG TPA: hypothetical protein DCM86_07165 [Verrucomicrobiales bacterium]|nr:hypothetical protein [Verrucomicrobiales bacterium]
MNRLEARKRLLIAESELQRAQVAVEAAAVVTRLREFADQGRSALSPTRLVAGLVEAIAGLRRPDPGLPAGASGGWGAAAVQGLGFLWTLWRTVRGRASK